MVTISTHNGSTVRREHNIRNRKVTDKEVHIDKNGIHETWVDEPIRNAYDRLFGDALNEYNLNQTRDDRRIDNYYNHVCKDAKKHPCYEMIIGVYGAECSDDKRKAILKTFVDTWSKRNPNLELIGAYYHADEQGEPHVHIDYIPIAHNYSKGLKTQNGLVKALGEMGYTKTNKITAQIKWEHAQNAFLEHLCEEYGLNVYHPLNGAKKHLKTDIYKLNAQRADLNALIGDMSLHLSSDFGENAETFLRLQDFCKRTSFADGSTVLDKFVKEETERLRDIDLDEDDFSFNH